MLSARTIKDITIDDNATRADFALGQRDSDLSTELTRLSLLGIAGYGFLIKEVLLKGDPATLPGLHAMAACKPNLFALVVSLSAFSIVLLGIAAAASLAAAHASTHCLNLQVEIVRLLQRKTNDDWPSETRAQNEEDLDLMRAKQGGVITLKKFSLKAAVYSLIVGAVMVAMNFAIVLWHAMA